MSEDTTVYTPDSPDASTDPNAPATHGPPLSGPGQPLGPQQPPPVPADDSGDDDEGDDE